MPAQQSQVPGGLGLGAALRSRAAAPVEPRADFSDLPGGIVNGEARLSEAKVGQYKPSEANNKKGIAGKDFVYLAGIIRSPAEVIETVKTWNAKLNNGKGAVEITGTRVVKIVGLRTNLTLPLCQTVKKVQGVDTVVTAAQNADAVLNELKMIGGEGCCASLAKLPANATDAQAKQALQQIMDAMVKAKIRFRFGTRAGDPSATYPSPMVFHQWHGSEGVDQGGQDNPAAVAASQTQDSSPPAPPDEPPADTAVPADDPDPDGAQTEADQLAAIAAEEDPTALLELAKEGNEPAQRRIHELAEAAGVDQEWREADDTTWEQIVEAIAAPPAEEPAAEPEPEPEPEPFLPAVKAVYGYEPPVKMPGGKVAKGKKQIDCSVTKVDKKAETVDLLSQIDKKTAFKAVPWADLIVS